MSHSGVHYTDDGECGCRAQDWERLIKFFLCFYAYTRHSLVVRYNCFSGICDFYDIDEMFNTIA